jgi:probable rRNA maturation factor
LIAVIEVEVFGEGIAPGAPPMAEVKRLCVLTTAAAGIDDGHLAIEYVDAATIARLNGEHRGKPEPTDVLSFPIDGADPGPGPVQAENGAKSGMGVRRISVAGPRELGDVLICPEHTADLREAIVHGVLHLVGMDHETDSGEMLALQAELLEREDP